MHNFVPKSVYILSEIIFEAVSCSTDKIQTLRLHSKILDMFFYQPENLIFMLCIWYHWLSQSQKTSVYNSNNVLQHYVLIPDIDVGVVPILLNEVLYELIDYL